MTSPALLWRIMTDPIPTGRPIQEICQGSLFCQCRPSSSPLPKRVVGGTWLSKYKKGDTSREARAANATYMREYRKRKGYGAS